MNLNTIIQRLSEPEKLISPAEINILQGYLNVHIANLEDDAWEKQLIASHKKVELMSDKSNTNGLAQAKWKTTEEYKDWITADMLSRKIKRYRSDLKDRFMVLMNLKRY